MSSGRPQVAPTEYSVSGSHPIINYQFYKRSTIMAHIKPRTLSGFMELLAPAGR